MIKSVYIEVPSDEAMDLAEDIVYIKEARLMLNKVRHINADRLYPILNLIQEIERETRYYMRHKYLNGPAKPVSEALRKRLKDDLRKEIPLNGYREEISASFTGENESDHEDDRQDRKGPEEH